MAEYIAKQDVLDALQKERDYLLKNKMYGAEHILVHHAYNIVDDLEPADVEPVIHCKDCDCYYFADNRVPEEQEWVCALLGRHMNPSDYCSRAYKKNRW